MRSPTQSTVWRDIEWIRASKSNIVPSSVSLSAVAIGAIEVTLDVLADRLLQRREAAVIAGVLQPTDIGLREILVAVADRWRHVDIAGIGKAAEPPVGCKHQIGETARLAGADVEDARHRRRRKQPHHHPHRIVDVDE